MQPTEFVPDAADLAVLAFRLGWPGELPTALPLDPKPVRRRARNSLIRFIPLALRRKLIPAALRRKFAGRRLPLHGWPVALSVPGPDDGRSWLPSVKLTGNPLD
jgi:hypothetical protein